MIKLKESKTFIQTNNDGIPNFQYIIDSFSGADTSKSKWNISIRNVELYNSFLSYKKEFSETSSGCIDFNNIRVENLFLSLRNIELDDSLTSFQIARLSGIEQSGFEIVNLRTKAITGKDFIQLSNFSAYTPQSKIIAPSIQFRFQSYSDFNSFSDKVNLKLDLKKSLISWLDIDAFIPGKTDFSQSVKISGKINGKINNLKGKDILLEAGKHSLFSFDFNATGLPAIKNTFLYLNIKNLVTSAIDIEKLEIPIGNNQILHLSQPFHYFGKITYKGNFTGFIDDFVAYGKLNSELGMVSTDILLAPGIKKQLNFSGKISTDNFNIGKLIDYEKYIGKTSLSLTAEGEIETKNIRARVNGTIFNLFANNYEYNNVRLNGELSNQNFQGEVHVSDQNIHLDFKGLIDFASSIPVFDFTADVSEIRLSPLHFIDNEDDISISLQIDAKTKGNSIDHFNGNIDIHNAWIRRKNSKIDMKEINILSSGSDNKRSLTLISDFLDCKISGNFHLSQIIHSVEKTISIYFPSAFPNYKNLEMKDDTLNNFTYQIQIKDLNPILGFFETGVEIAKNSKINGIFKPIDNDINMQILSDFIKFNQNSINDFSVYLIGNDSLLNLQVKSKNIDLYKYRSFYNIAFNSHGINDRFVYRTEWKNDADTLFKRGKIQGEAFFIKNPNNQRRIIQANIYPSELMIRKNIWNIDKCELLIDSSGYHITDDLVINNNNRTIKLSGSLSEDFKDTMKVDIQNIEIDDIEQIADLKGLSFRGKISGSALFSNVFKNPVFISDIKVAGFYFNKQDFGDLIIRSDWDNKNKTIELEAFTQKEKNKSIVISGTYQTLNQSLNFDIKTNILRMIWLNPLLSGVFSNINGLATGNLKLTGTPAYPILNGKLNIQKANFDIDYFKTTYIFTHTIEFEDNNIKLRNLPVTDLKNHMATINGSINNRYFNNWSLDLSITANNLLCMNTTERDNDLFFGTIYGSGMIKINGPTNDLSISGSIKSNPISTFSIPLKESAYLPVNDFITFLPPPNTGESATESPNFLIQPETTLTLNLDMEITPDLEAQIIFDPRIGDILKSRGNGILKLVLDRNGDMSIYGDYVIQSGDYLFTLQNVINKKFTINPGGILSWNGDPYNANIDIEAVYSLKTSIKDYIASTLYYGNAETGNITDKRIPVDCILHLSGKLMNPMIKTAIDLPTAAEEEKELLRNALSKNSFSGSSDVNQVNEQFISLLIINQFLPDPNKFLQTSYQKTPAITTYEFFSNQFNNFFSQFTDKWEIGFNYRPPDDFTKDPSEFFLQNQMEVALSTQLLNNRMTINGNVAYANNQSTNNVYVGDFDIEYKITNNGKLKVKAYHRTNDRIIYELSPHTQGIGLYYREEFDRFGDLFRKKSQPSDTIQKIIK